MDDLGFHIRMSVGVAAISFLASAAVANPDHHDGTGGEDGPFVSTGPIDNMGNMSDHLDMMRSMMAMHQSMAEVIQAQAEAAALFKGTDPATTLSTYDANGDGVIDMAEFAAWDTVAFRFAMVDRFQRLDADGGSAVGLEELYAAFDGMSTGGMMHDGAGMSGMMGGDSGMSEMMEGGTE